MFYFHHKNVGLASDAQTLGRNLSIQRQEDWKFSADESMKLLEKHRLMYT